MSTIPTSVIEKQFNEHIRPHLTTAKRGYECKIPLYKVFNYILYRLHTDTPAFRGGADLMTTFESMGAQSAW